MIYITYPKMLSFSLVFNLVTFIFPFSQENMSIKSVESKEDLGNQICLKLTRSPQQSPTTFETPILPSTQGGFWNRYLLGPFLELEFSDLKKKQQQHMFDQHTSTENANKKVFSFGGAMRVKTLVLTIQEYRHRSSRLIVMTWQES